MKACVVLSAVVALILPTSAVMGRTGQAQSPFKPPSNLLILPKDMKLATIVPLMKSFTNALGVRCEHCHVYAGTDPSALENFDFPSDVIPAKVTARKMMKVLKTLNEDLLKDIGEPRPADQPKTTCFTCHRGALKPLVQPGPPRL